MNGETRELSVNALASNMLCTRHNSALSPLDAVAATTVDYLRADQVDLEQPEDGSAFTLISGHLWERWMLKLLLGGMASGSLGAGGQRLEAWAPDVNVPGLVEVLFYGAPFPKDTGMAIRSNQPPIDAASGEIAVTGLSSASQGGLIGVAVSIGVLEIALSAVSLGDILRRRVGLARIARTDPVVEKLVAFAWESPITEVIDLTRHEGSPPADRPNGQQ